MARPAHCDPSAMAPVAKSCGVTGQVPIGARSWVSIAGQKADGSMRKIPVGAKATFKMSVRPEHLANQFKDAMLPQVLATPVMIMMMENATLNAIRARSAPQSTYRTLRLRRSVMR